MKPDIWLRRPATKSVNPISVLVSAFAGIFHKSIQRTPAEVCVYLSEFIDEIGQPYDWDDFISLTIADNDLEAIRAQAADVNLPVSAEGMAILRRLLAEARTLSEKPS